MVEFLVVDSKFLVAESKFLATRYMEKSIILYLPLGI